MNEYSTREPMVERTCAQLVPRLAAAAHAPAATMHKMRRAPHAIEPHRVDEGVEIIETLTVTRLMALQQWHERHARIMANRCECNEVAARFVEVTRSRQL